MSIFRRGKHTFIQGYGVELIVVALISIVVITMFSALVMRAQDHDAFKDACVDVGGTPIINDGGSKRICLKSDAQFIIE